jgi:hypothetical protein
MKTHEEEAMPRIVVRSHPPERLVRSLARGHIAGACCCCCCCCLHSVGSLSGAAVGSFFPRNREAPGVLKPLDKLRDDEFDAPARAVPAGPWVGSIYWMATLAAIVVTSLWAMTRPSAGVTGTLVILATFMPAVQLGGSVLCLLIIGGNPQLCQDARAWKRLGSVTLGTIIGCLLGILIMYIYVNSRR